MTFTLLDAILIVIMLISALLAMVRGFSREILSIVSWGAAAVGAYLLYPQVTPFAQTYISNETVAMAASALGVFLLILIIVSFITLRIADFIIDSRVGAVDRTLGFLFGAARGLLLVVVGMIFFNWLTPPQSGNQPEWVSSARSKPMLDDLGTRLVAVLPEDPQATIRDAMGEEPEPVTDPTAEQPAEAPTTIEGAIEGGQGVGTAPAN